MARAKDFIDDFEMDADRMHAEQYHDLEQVNFGMLMELNEKQLHSVIASLREAIKNVELCLVEANRVLSLAKIVLKHKEEMGDVRQSD